MNRRHVIILSIVAAHFLFVALGAIHRLPGRGPVATLAALSGAGSAFNFFAPGVGTQLRATFELDDAKGRHTEIGMQSRNREEELRLNNIVGTFWDQVSNEEVRRSLSASLAAEVLREHPGTRSIAVRLEGFDLPTLGEYRAGARPGWSLFYRARFQSSAPQETHHG